MNKFIVYVDDAEHLRLPLRALLLTEPAAHWLLVVCAPRATHRVSKWASHSSREQWRDKWVNKLLDQVLPQLAGHRTDWLTAQGPLADLTDELLQQGPARVLDWRRPKDSPALGGLPLVAAFGLTCWSLD